MYAWLSAQIGADAASVASYFAMTVMLLVAAWLCLAFFRRLNGENLHFPGRKRECRVSVRDTAAVDSRRRLVLIRRDNVEHLILVGGSGDMVIEGNIMVPDAAEQGKPVYGTQTGHRNAEKAEATRNTTRTEEKASVTPPSLRTAIAQEEAAAPVNQSAADQVFVPEQGERPAGQISHLPQQDPHPPVHLSPVPAGVPPQAHHTDALPNHPSSLQNGAPYAAPGQRPAVSRIQMSSNTQPFMTGNRPLRQKISPGQMPSQQQPSTVTASPDMAAGSRYSHHPARQNPISMQPAASRATRQMPSAPPAASHPAAATPRPNGSQGYVPMYQGYPNQPMSGHGTSATAANNGSNSHANLLNGDHLAATSEINTIQRVTGARREPVSDLSRRRQETGFNKMSSPGDEDFDKILQEELMRSQAGNKPVSSDKK